uniref:Uncharacterized protein n=1 Tax=Ascaris lumbricoides TaxID=6252 RepID=A0A9J2P1Y3_ASCLU
MSENLLSLTIKADKYLPINYNVLAYEEVCHIADVVMAHSNDEEKCQGALRGTVWYSGVVPCLESLFLAFLNQRGLAANEKAPHLTMD